MRCVGVLILREESRFGVVEATAGIGGCPSPRLKRRTPAAHTSFTKPTRGIRWRRRDDRDDISAYAPSKVYVRTLFTSYVFKYAWLGGASYRPFQRVQPLTPIHPCLQTVLRVLRNTPLTVSADCLLCGVVRV